MESLVLGSLAKIRKLTSTVRKHKHVKDACDTVIEHLKARSQRNENSESLVADTDADKFFEPFKLACETKSTKLQEIALDAIQKLVAYGYLRGMSTVHFSSAASTMNGTPHSASASGTAPNPKIGPAEDGTGTDEAPQILIDLVIQTICDCNEQQDDVVQLQIMKALLECVISSNTQVHQASLLQAVRACYNIHLVSRNQINKNTARATLTQMLAIVFHRMEEFDRRAREEAQAALQELVDNGAESRRSEDILPCGENLYPAVYIALQYTPQGSHPISLVQRGGDGPAASYGTPEFPSVLHKDAYLLFRALCRLSVKGQYDGDPDMPADPVALQSKILSLELLLSILEHAGPTFRSSEKFIYLVKNYLCSSLLKNATSSNTLVGGLSLRIFIAMTSHFKDSLKAELEVFISNIFLKLLESENSSFEHKMLVLEVFHNLCQDPQLLIEIFLNYDCDLGAISMFSRIVSALSKVANGRQLSQTDMLNGNKRVQEEMTLRRGGLEGLVAITQSLVKAGGLLAEDGEKGEGDAKVEEQTMEESNSVVVTAGEMSDVGAMEDMVRGHSLSIVESYDRKQRLQEEISLGLLKFNLKPSQGLAYLETHGHIQKTPSEVARFLHDYHCRLDKTVIGDYLGKEKEYDAGFCVKVLHNYVDMMDFGNFEFDQAIRHFLAGFRLPGEAQKIDRIMEKFAERYCLQNPAVFPSADTAFILSFSIIMLNTDLHNPSVREDRKMTRDDFLRNNRGISSGTDLPEEFLSRIYDNIKRSPISLKEDDDMRARLAAPTGTENPFLSTLSLDKRRKEAYHKEREAMVQASEAIFRQRKRREAAGKGTIFRTPLEDPAQYVRPMFEVAWGSMLSVFSQTLKTSEDPKMTELSLEGFCHAIRIAARFNLPIARDLLVNTLYKFTTLAEVKEVQPKNIDCIKSLMSVALTEGNFLQDSWFDILQCISHLARLQLFASGLQSDDVYFPAEDKAGERLSGSRSGAVVALSAASLNMSRSSATTPLPARKRESTSLRDQFRLFSQPSKAEAARQVEEFNAEQIMGSIDSATIERVFTQSVSLDSQAIQYFVIKLCEVSKQEVAVGSAPAAGAYRPKLDTSSEANQPRVFSLQKLVEVADFNMTSRSRLVWANVWEVLSRHYAAVGLHENVSVAMYAIDSLRQLSIKFLYKDELRDFNFQRLFLKPFEIIMASARLIEIKELILRCIDNLISVRAHNIRSGWRSIFTVFSLAATSADEGIAQFAFDMTDQLFRNHFDLLVFDFVDLVHCLLAFAENRYHLHISLAAIAHLQRAATLLAESTGSNELGHPLQQAVLSSRPNLYTNGPISPKGTILNIPAPSPSAPSNAGSTASEDSILQLWWPLLVGLSARVADSRLAARTSALEALMNTLRQYGQQFSAQTWKLLFRGVLSPILESARTDCTPQVISETPTCNPPLEVREESWILTTTEPVLQSYVELLRLYWSRTKALVPEVLAVISDCVCQHERETLARIAASVMHRHVVMGLAEEMKDTDLWDALSITLLIIVRKNLPEWGQMEALAASEEVMSEAGPLRDLSGSEASFDGAAGRTRDVQVPGKESTLEHRAGGVTQMGEIQEEEAGQTDVSGNDFSSQHGEIELQEEIEDGAERLTMESARLGRDACFSFAMVNNGVVMTQMVVSLLAQQMIKDLLHTQWLHLSEDNLTHIMSALTESADYAAEFNANLALRDRLRQGGLMAVTGRRPSGSGDGTRESGIGANLPHLLEQAIGGYSILLRSMLRLYHTPEIQEAEKMGIVAWDRRPLAERIVVRYVALVFKQYVQIEEELQRERRAAAKFSVAARHAMNTEAAAYTPLVHFLLKSIRSFTVQQVGWHIDWLYPAVTELLIVRSLEVRREVRSLLQEQVAAYALGRECLPAGQRPGLI